MPKLAAPHSLTKHSCNASVPSLVSRKEGTANSLCPPAVARHKKIVPPSSRSLSPHSALSSCYAPPRCAASPASAQGRRAAASPRRSHHRLRSGAAPIVPVLCGLALLPDASKCSPRGRHECTLRTRNITLAQFRRRGRRFLNEGVHCCIPAGADRHWQAPEGASACEDGA